MEAGTSISAPSMDFFGMLPSVNAAVDCKLFVRRSALELHVMALHDVVRVFQDVSGQHGDDVGVLVDETFVNKLANASQARGRCGFATDAVATDDSFCIPDLEVGD